AGAGFPIHAGTAAREGWLIEWGTRESHHPSNLLSRCRGRLSLRQQVHHRLDSERAQDRGLFGVPSLLQRPAANRRYAGPRRPVPAAPAAEEITRHPVEPSVASGVAQGLGGGALGAGG